MRSFTASAGEKGRVKLWGSFAIALLISAWAISNQSLWIDEALTARKAQQSTLAGWWNAIVAEKASDLQMPLYMIYIWCFEKAFGPSEWVLRAANLPMFAIGTFAFIKASNQRRLAVALVVSLSPFAWFYLDEARPYAVQLGASLLIFAALYTLSREQRLSDLAERLWCAGFYLGMIVLCGSSLLGMIWAGAPVAAAAVIFLPRRMAELWRSHRGIGLISAGFTVVLGVYFLWTLKVGARASGAATTDWKNIVFTSYELFGFSGLGPGRLEIREGGLNSFQAHWIKLAVYGAFVLILFGVGLRRAFEAGYREKASRLVLIIAAPAGVLLTAGIVMHFRVLGRHFTPLMPVILFLLSTGSAALWFHGGWLRKVIVCGFFLLSLFSCLSLRFSARHEKDNYRGAAAFARAALQSGKQVWWSADNQGAAYYQVPTTDQPAEVGRAWRVLNPARESLWGAPVPEVIITSKPDIFDSQGSLADYIAQMGFNKTETLSAFSIWQRSRK